MADVGAGEQLPRFLHLPPISKRAQMDERGGLRLLLFLSFASHAR